MPACPNYAQYWMENRLLTVTRKTHVSFFAASLLIPVSWYSFTNIRTLVLYSIHTCKHKNKQHGRKLVRKTKTKSQILLFSHEGKKKKK